TMSEPAGNSSVTAVFGATSGVGAGPVGACAINGRCRTSRGGFTSIFARANRTDAPPTSCSPTCIETDATTSSVLRSYSNPGGRASSRVATEHLPLFDPPQPHTIPLGKRSDHHTGTDVAIKRIADQEAERSAT